MNIDQITPACFVMALFIRDDGERFLLGDGAYEFQEEQLHFAPNTVVNSVVELQGANGQIISGQVLRSTEQTFAGYIGDATTSPIATRDYQQDFSRFFQIDHRYDVVYITNQTITIDGTTIPFALRRSGGYISTAPTTQLLRYSIIEYSVGFEFEEVEYRLYAEDEDGNPIAVQTSGELTASNSAAATWTTTNLTGFKYSPVITISDFSSSDWQSLEFYIRSGTSWASMSLNFPLFAAGTYTVEKIVVDVPQRTVIGTLRNSSTSVASDFNLTSYLIFYNDWLESTAEKGASITTEVSIGSNLPTTAKAIVEYNPIWQ